MIWKLVSRSYHSPPYRIEPGIRGWSCWCEAKELTRIGSDIESLRAAKALAKRHFEINTTETAK